MNVTSTGAYFTELPPAIEQLLSELPQAVLYTLIPFHLFYSALYFKISGRYNLYKFLTAISLLATWIAPYITPLHCGPARSLQNFGVAIGTMKMLDIWARRHSLPTYTGGPVPPDWLFPFIMITELRYESFTPNHVRVPKHLENFSEPIQLGIHLLGFLFLQALPQEHPTVLAFEVLLAIYIIWTTIQLVVRYKTSPALFGPLYLADSLTGFWSETWHNAFASPCTSLAYSPIRYGLSRLGVPISIARSCGVLGAFVLMAAFHMYALAPIMTLQGLRRIGIFFLLNGFATVSEAAVWGHRKHWAKTIMAWTFEVLLATWTAETAGIPHGLANIPWRDMCDAPPFG